MVASVVIAKTFFTAKTFRAHSTNYLQQEKSLRDPGAMAQRKSE
jgi:hypothetical protein